MSSANTSAHAHNHDAQSIFRLEETVVNRIAAGEIVQRPASALKELLENAIDAKATSIEVLVKDGGLRLLQITDNGSGIHLSDMPILCERFTTSKLRRFVDLNTISTYGFRGEALASITHISKVTVTTKTSAASCAYRAVYIDGSLVPAATGASPDPKPVAGNLGTQITVEDMFYNVPSRKRALNKPSEEYAKIVDVVNKYSIHHDGIAFTCKRAGDKMPSLSTSRKNTTVDNIRLVYGAAVANDLLPFELVDEKNQYKIRGLISNANYHVKKANCIIFTNDRLVESVAIRRSVESAYQAYLPKGGHSFAYLAVHVEPSRVDVNVHPTKREVNLLDEELIVASLALAIQKRLSDTESSRNFPAQTVLQGTSLDASLGAEKIRRVVTSERPQNPAQLVRTDPRQQTLNSMLDHAAPTTIKLDPTSLESETLTGRARVSIRLASIKELRASVRTQIHEDLTAIFTEHVFVGIVDLERRLCVIQHLTKLYLVDYGAISAELFYQIGLSEFGNFGSITLRPALDLKAVLKIALTTCRTTPGGAVHVKDSSDVENMFNCLYAHKDMLLEYFALEISADGYVSAIPLLLRDYTPAISKLPNFLYRLCQNVDWHDEKKCFGSFILELALFYVPEVFQGARKCSNPLHKVHDNQLCKCEAVSTEKNLREAIEDVLFPSFKRRLIASKQLAKDNRVRQIGELNQLYKTFERC